MRTNLRSHCQLEPHGSGAGAGDHEEISGANEPEQLLPQLGKVTTLEIDFSRLIID
jgi:hypothetical protein